MIINHEIYYPLYTDKEHFIILVTGGRGSGKSFGIGGFLERLSFELKRKGLSKAESDKIVHKILYTRYTMTSASISIIPEFLEKIELDGTTRYFHTTKTDIINKMTGSRIMFRGIKTSSGNQTAKLKSIHGITTFVCDEAEEWTSDREFETIAFSIRQVGIQNRIIIIMNPTDSNHFIYQKYIKDTHRIEYFDGVPVQISTHPQVLHIHTTYLDNKENLSEEFIRSAQEMKERDPERYGHIFMGRWADVAEGAVFKKWGIVSEFPKNCKHVARGLDFGYSNDVSACVKCGVVGNDLYIDEQIFETGLLSKDLIRKLSEDDSFVFADSADPRLIDEIGLGGVIIYPVAKPAGSIIAGIEKMKSFDNIFITERSLNVQDEFRNYVWAKDKDGNYINVPEDRFNHCFTGDTLIMTTKGQIPISEITTNDYVLTSNGCKRVENTFNNGLKKILHIRLIFANFVVELKGTPDHKIKTVDGWKQLQELTKGDVLYLCKPLMERSTRSIPEKDTSREDVSDYTASSGSIITVQSPKGVTSTTKTVIPTITKSETSKSWSVKNTYRYMLKSTTTILKCLPSCVIEWIMPEGMQINGIVQKKASNGIENTAKRWQRILSRLNLRANGVERSLCPSHVELTNSAQTDVKRSSDTIPVLTTKQEFASNAAKSLSQTNTHELTIAPGDARDCIAQPCVLKGIEIVAENTAKVYDIQVADIHEYFANGILVHNCVDASRYYVLGCILGKILKPKNVKKSDLGIF